MAAGYGELAELIRREHAERGSPYLVSISGGVAVGKSWTSDRLRELLTEPGGLQVEVVGSDGFLYPNVVLDRLGLSGRKGFPETYDREALTRFLGDVRARRPDLSAPVYSHLTYDVVEGGERPIGRPDVLIVEGLGLLGAQANDEVGALFDLSIFLDADETDLEAWFLTRFRQLWQAGVDDETSFFHRFAGMGEPQVDELARAVWRSVNVVNLREHIRPARPRARVVIEKGADHSLIDISVRSIRSIRSIRE
jgi:type I pantothenate kinase